MAMSRRFSQIKVKTDISDDEAEPEDIAILKLLIGSEFRYSDPSGLGFSLERSDSVQSDTSDADDDCLKMNRDWRADFEVSLKRSRQNSETINKMCCLKIPANSLSPPIGNNIQTHRSADEVSSNDKHVQMHESKTENLQKLEIDTEQVEHKNKELKLGLADKTNVKKNDNQTQKNVTKPNKGTHTTGQLKEKKDGKKGKVYNIKPAMSFPLDDLLPSNKPSPIKDNTVSDTNVEPSTTTVIPSQDSSNEIESDQNMFHGTICLEDNAYRIDSISNNTLNKDTFVEGSSLRVEEPMYVNEADNYSMKPVNKTRSFMATANNVSGESVADILEAMQYGNKIAIENIKTALNEQISKSRQFTSIPGVDKITVEGRSFGFYNEHTDSDKDWFGEKSEEELFELFVKQIYALVQTEEDKVKVESFLTVLKEEWKGRLSCTGLSPHSNQEKLSMPQTTNRDSQMASEKVENNVISNEDKELFEGRTLLKGGVHPRHIPKTNTYKDQQGRAMDPRQMMRNRKKEVKIKVPDFYEDFRREMKNREKKIPYNSKDPRCLRMLSDEPGRLCISPVEDTEVIKNQNESDDIVSMAVPEHRSQGKEIDKNSVISLNVAKKVESSYIGKKWDQEQQSVIKVIIGHSAAEEVDIPLKSANEFNFRQTILQDVKMIENTNTEKTSKQEISIKSLSNNGNVGSCKEALFVPVRASDSLRDKQTHAKAENIGSRSRSTWSALHEKSSEKEIKNASLIGARAKDFKACSVTHISKDRENMQRKGERSRSNGNTSNLGQRLNCERSHSRTRETDYSKHDLHKYNRRILESRRSSSRSSADSRELCERPGDHCRSSSNTRMDIPQRESDRKEASKIGERNTENLRDKLNNRSRERSMEQSNDQCKYKHRDSRTESVKDKYRHMSRESSIENMYDKHKHQVKHPNIENSYIVTDQNKRRHRENRIENSYSMTDRNRLIQNTQARQTPPQDSGFDLRHTLSSNHRKRPHAAEEVSSHITEVLIHDQYSAHSLSKISPFGEGRNKEKVTHTLYCNPKDRGDSDLDLSDEEIKAEFRMRYTKSYQGDGNQAGSSNTGLFSSLKQSLPKKPFNLGGAKSRKALKQVEDDRKFLEEFKKKILPSCSSSKGSQNQSSSNTSSTNMSVCSDNGVSSGILSYSDMLNLADLEEK